MNRGYLNVFCDRKKRESTGKNASHIEGRRRAATPSSSPEFALEGMLRSSGMSNKARETEPSKKGERNEYGRRALRRPGRP